MSERIEEMYAFVMTDDDGTEGIIGMNDGLQWHPLVGGDMARVESLIPLVRGMCEGINKQIRILKFSHREQIGELNPKEGPHA
jgi:hypothetical protein